MKRILRQATISALANPFCGAMMKPLWNGSASIFMLHRMFHPELAPDGTSSSSIAENIASLRRAGAQLVSLRYLVDCAAEGIAPDPGCVAFTIDDGYADQGVLAREFVKHDCPVTIFLISGFIDRQLWAWDERLAYGVMHSSTHSLSLPGFDRTLGLESSGNRREAIDALQKYFKTRPADETESLLNILFDHLEFRPPAQPPAQSSPLSWDEVRSLETAGVDFGPHSVTHRIASRLDAEQSKWEIATSWGRLSEELSRPLPVYAWPTGRRADFLPRDMAIARSLGLHGAVSTNDGYADFASNPSDPDRLFHLDRFAFAQEVDINLQYGTAIEKLKSRARSFLA